MNKDQPQPFGHQTNTLQNKHFTDPEMQVIKAALDFFRNAKQQSLVGPSPLPFAGQMNQFDILTPQHTLMHTLSALSKLTGQPVAYFMNPQPSQNPPPVTHPTDCHVATTPSVPSSPETAAPAGPPAAPPHGAC